MNKKKVLYIIIFIIGLSSLIIGFFQSSILKILTSNKIIITNNYWIITFGFIFTLAGLTLFFLTDSKNKKYFQKSLKLPVIETIVITILIITSAGIGGWLYGQYQKSLLISSENMKKIDEKLKMFDQMETNNPFFSKKVILRDDDIGDSMYLSSLSWITNFCMDNNITLTLSVIPTTLINNSETINYLNQLERKYFEFATHGYEHIHFQDISYEVQISLIENGTKRMQDTLGVKPFSFIPPQASSDTNTTKALRLLGYHSITDMIGYPSYIVDFTSDFTWEIGFHPPKHHTIQDFKNNFDNFYNSSDEYYMLVFHDWTFLDEKGNLDEEKVYSFEEGMNYIKNKNIQFMTIEESYQWHIDENILRTGMINEYRYFLDLGDCIYNHTIKFSNPSKWNGTVHVLDISSGTESILNQKKFEFDAEKGHLYEFTCC